MVNACGNYGWMDSNDGFYMQNMIVMESLEAIHPINPPLTIHMIYLHNSEENTRVNCKSKFWYLFSCAQSL